MQGWHAFIHDPALADAVMDRLIHSSHKLALRGESMRKTKVAKSGK
ncbi:ATP-binding protein [Xanthomonas campestris]|nr:ATP-binding protein [Xanthomonas campestris]